MSGSEVAAATLPMLATIPGVSVLLGGEAVVNSMTRRDATLPAHVQDADTQVHVDQDDVDRIVAEHLQPHGVIGFISGPFEFLCGYPRGVRGEARQRAVRRARLADSLLFLPARACNCMLWWAGAYGVWNVSAARGKADFELVLPILVVFVLVNISAQTQIWLRPSSVHKVFTAAARTHELLRRRDPVRRTRSARAVMSSVRAVGFTSLLGESNLMATQRHVTGAAAALSSGPRANDDATSRHEDRRTESFAARIERLRHEAINNALVASFAIWAVNTSLAVTYVVLPGLTELGLSSSYRVAGAVLFSITNTMIYAALLGVEAIDWSVVLNMYITMLSEYQDDLRNWRKWRCRNNVLNLRWAVAAHRAFRNAFFDLSAMPFMRLRMIMAALMSWLFFMAFQLAYMTPAHSRYNPAFLFGLISTPLMLVGTVGSIIVLSNKILSEIPRLANELLADVQSSDAALLWSDAMEASAALGGPLLDDTTTTGVIAALSSRPHVVAEPIPLHTLPTQRESSGETSSEDASLSPLDDSSAGDTAHANPARDITVVVDVPDEPRVPVTSPRQPAASAPAAAQTPVAPQPQPSASVPSLGVPPVAQAVPQKALTYAQLGGASTQSGYSGQPPWQPHPTGVRIGHSGPVWMSRMSTEDGTDWAAVRQTALLHQRQVYALERFQHYVLHSDIGLRLLGVRLDKLVFVKLISLGIAACFFVGRECLIGTGVMRT